MMKETQGLLPPPQTTENLSVGRRESQDSSSVEDDSVNRVTGFGVL